jgi:nitrogen fixation protein FixH
MSFLSKARSDAAIQYKEVMNLTKIESIEKRLQQQEDMIAKRSLDTGEFKGPVREIRQLQSNLEKLETEQLNSLNQEGRQIAQELTAMDNEIKLCENLGRLLEQMKDGKQSYSVALYRNRASETVPGSINKSAESRNP